MVALVHHFFSLKIDRFLIIDVCCHNNNNKNNGLINALFSNDDDDDDDSSVHLHIQHKSNKVI